MNQALRYIINLGHVHAGSPLLQRKEKFLPGVKPWDQVLHLKNLEEDPPKTNCYQIWKDMYKSNFNTPLLLSNSKGYPVGYIVQIKIISPRNPTGCNRRTLYTCEPVEDLRYLFKRQAPQGNSWLFSLSPAAAGPQ